MKKLILLFSFIIANAYYLEIDSQKDYEKLKQIGISCYKKQNSYFCLKNDDKNALRRVKDYLKKIYKIDSLIVEDNLANNITVKKEKNIQSTKTIVNYNNTSGYCIQVAASTNLEPLKKMYQEYKDYPYSRIEKIGNYYVLRVGEDESYTNIKNLKTKLNKGLIRKCYLIKDRIIISNNLIVDKKQNIDKNNILNDNYNNKTYSLKAMYYYLNNGNLYQANKIATYFYNKNMHINDSLRVLGIVSIKQQKWKKACNYLSKLYLKTKLQSDLNLRNNACSVYNMKKGYMFLSNQPQTALNYFYKSNKYKENIDSKKGIAYAKYNLKEYNQSLEIVNQLLKQNPNDKDLILLKAQILYSLNKTDELDKLIKKYPNFDFSNLELEIKLKKANKLIKDKKYKEAEKILLGLYKNNPDNVNILLSLGNLYLQTNENDKSLMFYKNALIIEKNNIYALRGLEAIYLKKGNYKKALEVSSKIEKLGFKDENKEKILKLYYLQQAKKELKNDPNKAKNYLNKVLKIDKNCAEAYMILGDIAYTENNEKGAYLNYSKGYKLDKDNFNIKLKFMYSLIKLNLFSQVKVILTTINKDKLNQTELQKLKKLYDYLYFSYANYLYNQKEYKKTKEVIKEGLQINPKNYDLYNIKAWVCFQEKDYICAKKNFKKYLKNKNDNNAKYGLALVYIKLSDYKKADTILDNLAKSNISNDMKLKVADAYIQIDENNKANRLLNRAKVSGKNVNKKKVYKKINTFFPLFFDVNTTSNQTDVYKKKIQKLRNKILKDKEKRNSNILLAFHLREKSGESGMSKLQHTSFPYLKFNYYINDNWKLFGIYDRIILDSNSLNNYEKVGSQSRDIKQEFKTKVEAKAYKLGVNYKKYNDNYEIMIGLSPYNKITKKVLIGHLKYQTKNDNNTYSFMLSREIKKDSILSYVGNVDPYSDTVWGRVISNSLIFDYTNNLDKNGSFNYFKLKLSYLNGENVEKNNEIYALFYNRNYLNYYYLYNYLGFYVNLDSYKKDNNFFYLNKGGYYSPYLFLLLALRYEGYYSSNNKGFKLFLMPGLDYSNSKTGSNTGVYIDLGATGKIVLNNRFSLELGSDYRYGKDYNDYFLYLGIRWYFNNHTYIRFKELDNLMKGVTQW